LNHTSRAAQGGLSDWAKTLFSIFYAIFLVGGLVFGYLFYSTIKEIVAYVPLSAPLALPQNGAGTGGTLSDPVAPSGQPNARLEAPPVPDQEWDRPGRVNILLLGVDQRKCEPPPSRTDTMILVTVDPQQKTAAMLSIPRDLWVEIPGDLPGVPAENRINTAHVYGEIKKYPGGGPALAMRTVEKNFGIPVDYYVRINFEGFKQIVDALGGIDIDVPKAVHDDAFPDDTCGTHVVDIPAGKQHMDGQRAMEYARSRHGSSDFDRAARQQEVLYAMRDRAISLNVITRLPQLYQALNNTIDTDMQVWEMFALARAAWDIPRDNIQSYVIDANMTVPWKTPQGADVLIPKREEIGQLLEQIFGPVTAARQ
jgi:LCP family protein required for cell wall assembly